MADGNKKFEILSFDPRGVGRTTPSADCYRNEYARGNGLIMERAIGTLGAGEAVLKRKLAQAKGFAEMCAKRGRADDVRNFMSTTSVARDMAKIVDELHVLRHAHDADQDQGGTDARVELRSEKQETSARLNYWGWSYATDLGNYFVSMFPGRVERMILEGVQDVRDYADGTWLKFGDAEKTFDYFWDACYGAGKSCALYQELDTDAGDARARFDAFMEEVNQDPQSYVGPDGTITSITEEDVMLVIFSALPQPILTFPSLAETLMEAMAGNFSTLYRQLAQPSAESCPLPIPDTFTWTADARIGIACGDGEPQNNMTLAAYQDYMAGIAADAPNFWPFMADIRLPCVHWPFRPKDRFKGPWVTPKSDPSRVPGRPTAPLLFISSRYDLWTPPSRAVEMSRFHPGSTVLVQENYGHGTIATPSKCRDDHVKKYFDTGEVPPDGAVCDSDCVPFRDCPGDADVKKAWLGHAEYSVAGRRVAPSGWF
ncbi:hypothetical protein LMH87_000158 [Akanthomyces muscarius]|uniref:Peptidase S33 tripeptidyl aminopeptidase-like C-terminal domain-containing protein n=1 Tax=Akanthomyces muscarius TaxID=2231603 RepID=A0A9W8QEW4_AKAMU|nr:hypothetical protein LMH87_000158 [Akanthomyces muscarius]KAJ4154884.1 hypothetical protein LMH87_000158 [Akanthomyces muscarius]